MTPKIVLEIIVCTLFNLLNAQNRILFLFPQYKNHIHQKYILKHVLEQRPDDYDMSRLKSLDRLYSVSLTHPVYVPYYARLL